MNMCNTYKVFETDFNVMFIKKGKDDEEFPLPQQKRRISPVILLYGFG